MWATEAKLPRKPTRCTIEGVVVHIPWASEYHVVNYYVIHYICQRAAIRGAGYVMKVNENLLRQLVSDLGLDRPFLKGQNIPIKNCWHFSTDGNAVDFMFYDEEDFINGMNRIFVLLQKNDIVILAFILMDTHIHFILWGSLEDCNKFVHEYVRQTSRHISITHGDRKKLENVPVHYQTIDTDYYLKTALCYVIKNAPVGGLPYNALDYPWSSGPLYFRHKDQWSSPSWHLELDAGNDSPMGVHEKRYVLHTRSQMVDSVKMIGPLVFPGEYVAFELVERVFKTCKGFNFFMCCSKESDVDSRGGAISRLSIPMQEMRQHKNEVCRELFGTTSVKGLDTRQRIRLAKTLKSRYDSSVKQITRLTGLVYDEVKDLF